MEDFEKFKRRIRLRSHFDDHEEDPDREAFNIKFHLPKSDWQPPAANERIEKYLQETEQTLVKAIDDLATLTVHPNLDKNQRLFLKQIKEDPTVIIKPTDKNLGLCLMDRTWYDKEIERQLNDSSTYTVVSPILIPTQSIYNEILQLTADARRKNLITSKQFVFVRDKVTNVNAVIPEMYILPKVHKPKLAGRPIVPGVNWITTPASILLDDLLQPLTRRIPTILTDSNSLIRDLEKHNFDPDIILITADVSSLYTEIKIDIGIAFVAQLLRENPDLYPAEKSAYIVSLLRLVMKGNYLRYGDKFYHQIKGTAMGTPVAPIFANIFMYLLERKVLDKYGDSIVYYKRYLDDIFLICKKEKKEEIMTSLQSMEKNIKLEFVVSDDSATFLDLFFYKGERFHATGMLDFKIHQKALNKYLYLPHGSYHTDSSKKGFIKAELQRYIRSSSSIENYIEMKKVFFARLRNRGYPSDFITKIFETVKYKDRETLLTPRKRHEDPQATVRMITELNPLSAKLNLNEILHRNLSSKLNFDVGTGFRNGKSLQDMVNSKALPGLKEKENNPQNPGNPGNLNNSSNPNDPNNPNNPNNLDNPNNPNRGNLEANNPNQVGSTRTHLRKVNPR